MFFATGEDGDEANDATTGYQLRHRQVTANASADGTECPPLSQLRRCNLFVTDKSDDDDGDDKEEEEEEEGEEEEDTNRSTFSVSCARWEVLPLLDVCHLDGVAAAGTSTNNNNNNNNNNGTATATSCGRGYHELAFRCQRYDGVRIFISLSSPSSSLFFFIILIIPLNSFTALQIRSSSSSRSFYFYACCMSRRQTVPLGSYLQ